MTFTNGYWVSTAWPALGMWWWVNADAVSSLQNLARSPAARTDVVGVTPQAGMARESEAVCGTFGGLDSWRMQTGRMGVRSQENKDVIGVVLISDPMTLNQGHLQDAWSCPASVLSPLILFCPPTHCSGHRVPPHFIALLETHVGSLPSGSAVSPCPHFPPWLHLPLHSLSLCLVCPSPCG